MKNIGFLGLGSMGLKMAKNLLKAGFHVSGTTRNEQRRAEFLEMGGVIEDNLAIIGETSEVIVACLPDDNIVRDFLYKKDGLLSGGKTKFQYFIDTSTIDVTAAKEIGAELLAKGIYYFDSPVSGGPKGAETGTLTIMVGGDESAFKTVLPVYQAMGEKIMHFGENGSAQQIKLINQILTWVNHAVICEAAVLAKKAGLDEEKLYECIMSSYGYSKIFEVTYPSHIQPEFYENPTGMSMMMKDLKLADQFAKAFDVKLPMTNTSLDLYQKAIDDGHGDKDQSIIIEQLKNMRY